MQNQELIDKCRTLIKAFKEGKLGQTKMPEDSNPGFSEEDFEARLAYFTLPMALNYQRNSYKLWESALKTYKDKETNKVFNIKEAANMGEEELKNLLTKYKLALQPNKHIHTWKTISKTVYGSFGSFSNLIKEADNDYLKLREIVQVKRKKDFPYLCGPKIFNYWCFILKEYEKIRLKNSKFIEIAPDTHITKCSVILSVIDNENISKEEISRKWREALEGSEINPIDMHAPLWFWSRNGFMFKL
jgi:hypothetical protein